jgi:CP family cyanate transporter-like MFS transporter
LRHDPEPRVTAPGRSSRGAARIVAGLLLAGFALRFQLAGVGPLIPAIQRDLQLDHVVVGLFVTVPLAAIGLAALVAPRISRLLSSRGSLTAGLLAVGVIGALRVLPDSFAVMIALSIPVGVGVGLGTAGFPIAIRAYLPAAPAKATAVYAFGLYVGAMVAAASAVPLSSAVGGWRLALLSLSIITLLVAAAWHVLARRDHPASSATTQTATDQSWVLPGLGAAIAVYALRSAVFQGYNAWLPSIYVERGWTPEAAGGLLAVLVGSGAVAVLLVGPLADWRGSRRSHLAASALLLLIGSGGLAALPDFGWLWAVVVGLAVGAQFTVSLTLPLDLARTRSSLAATAAIIVGVGSLVGSVTPTALGALRDLSGSFAASSWSLAGLAACLVVAAALFRAGAPHAPAERPASGA